MRHGQIIEEGSPQHVLDKYQTDSLESCFLTACHNERNNEVCIVDLFNNSLQSYAYRILIFSFKNGICLLVSLASNAYNIGINNN